jgi:hypothetical protein
MTTVIDLHGRDKKSLLADPAFVYVGREARGGWKRSLWHNPFRLPKVEKGRTLIVRSPGILTPADAVAAYAELVRREGREEAIRRELRGKVLGCWCGNWRPGEPEVACHAVVLAKIADAEG